MKKLFFSFAWLIFFPTFFISSTMLAMAFECLSTIENAKTAIKRPTLSGNLKTAFESIKTEYIADEEKGVKIYRSDLDFKSTFLKIYEEVFQQLFVKANADGVENFFLAKFGALEVNAFAHAFFDEFKKFVDENPSSKIKIILIGYEPHVSQAFSQVAASQREKPYGERVLIQKNNLADILHNLHWSEEYRSISAVFSPIQGMLGAAVDKIIAISKDQKPAVGVNLNALITNFSHKAEVEVGSSNAPSATHTLAQFLSQSQDMSKWVILTLTSLELKISKLQNMKTEFNNILERFRDKKNIIIIPLTELAGILNQIEFFSEIHAVPSGIYIILHSTQLKTTGDKYRALANFLHIEKPLAPFRTDMVFTDFLSNKLANDPVVNSHGITFERSVIMTWIKYADNVDPVTREKVMGCYPLFEKQVTKAQMETVLDALAQKNLNKDEKQNLIEMLRKKIVSLAVVYDASVVSYLKLIRPILNNKFGKEEGMQIIIKDIDKLSISEYVNRAEMPFSISRDDWKLNN